MSGIRANGSTSTCLPVGAAPRSSVGCKRMNFVGRVNWERNFLDSSSFLVRCLRPHSSEAGGSNTYGTRTATEDCHESYSSGNNGVSTVASKSGSAGGSSQHASRGNAMPVAPRSWESWTEYFNAMDDTVRELNAVDEEIEMAVKQEDYTRASALHQEQERMEALDMVLQIQKDLDLAISEERYDDAAHLRDDGGTRLLGWWVGREGENDAQGHLLHITQDFSRYVGHAFTGSMLAKSLGWTGDSVSSPFDATDGEAITFTVVGEDNGEDDFGTPVFEVFYRKGSSGWEHQAVVLNSPVAALPSGSDLEELSAILASQVGEGANVISVEKGKDPDGTGYVKINLANQSQSGSIFDIQNEGEDEEEVLFIEEDDDNIRTVDDLARLIDSDEGSSDTAHGVVSMNEVEDGNEDGDNEDLFAALTEMGSAMSLSQRVPAEVDWKDKDSFVLKVDPVKQKEILAPSEELLTSKIAASEDSMKELEEMVRAALGKSRDQEGSNVSSPAKFSPKETSTSSEVAGLEGEVTYRRLRLPSKSTDMFNGLYLGSFGPHGPEVISVARGQVEGEEWVFGHKLTGDVNVPAGEVSFKAKVGRENKLSSSGVYPVEYGIQARYPGQGRVAREGFKSAKWVDGELLVLTKSNSITRGAELGFVFNVDASRKFLLLFENITANFLKD